MKMIRNKGWWEKGKIILKTNNEKKETQLLIIYNLENLFNVSYILFAMIILIMKNTIKQFERETRTTEQNWRRIITSVTIIYTV